MNPVKTLFVSGYVLPGREIHKEVWSKPKKGAEGERDFPGTSCQ